MPLSPLQKQAGRAFRDACQAVLDKVNEQDPPDAFVQPFWRVVRHECRAAGEASIGITLRERYEPSPEYLACYCGTVGRLSGTFPHGDCDGSKVASQDGEFAFIWKSGRCSGCGHAVRTRRGLFAVATDRPPDHGRANDGRPAGAHAGDPRLSRA